MITIISSAKTGLRHRASYFLRRNISGEARASPGLYTRAATDASVQYCTMPFILALAFIASSERATVMRFSAYSLCLFAAAKANVHMTWCKNWSWLWNLFIIEMSIVRALHNHFLKHSGLKKLKLWMTKFTMPIYCTQSTVHWY